MPDINFLSQTDIFKGIKNYQLDLILSGCIEKKFKKEKTIFKENETADRLLIVVDGEVDIRFDLPGSVNSKEITIYIETSSRCLGWSCFVPPYKYLLSAICGTDRCTVLILKKSFLTELFESDLKLGYQVMSNLAEIIAYRFHQMQDSDVCRRFE